MASIDVIFTIPDTIPVAPVMPTVMRRGQFNKKAVHAQSRGDRENTLAALVKCASQWPRGVPENPPFRCLSCRDLR
jgi:hypothetical protein